MQRGSSSKSFFVFRKNKGTREAILALRLIIEEIVEKGETAYYIELVDIKKVFSNASSKICMKYWENEEVKTEKEE